MSSSDNNFSNVFINQPPKSGDTDSKHDFEDIIKTLKVGIAVINYGSTISLEYANDYLYEIIGYSASEFKSLFGNNILARVYPDDIQRMKNNISRQMSMGGTIRYEFRLIKKDGSISWISMNGTKHYSDTLRLRVTFTDITESKTLYNDIAEKNLELDTIYNNIHGGLVKLTMPDFRVNYANEGFYEMIGYTKEEFLHKYNNVYLELVANEDFDIINSLVDISNNNLQVTIRVTNSRGELCWHLLNATRIGSLDGKPFYLCTIVDITKNKTYEHKLELEQKKQQILADISGEWVWEYEIATNTLVRSSQSSFAFDDIPRIHHYREHTLQKNIIHPDDIALFNAFCDQMKLGKDKIELDLRIINKLTGDYSWYRAVGTTLYDNDNNPISVIGKTFINDEMHETIHALEEKTTKDALTKLYNRTAVQDIITSTLNSTGRGLKSALLLADIDNFRSINDSLGHLFGDSILIEAGHIFTRLCPDNIVGRVGTDVFAIFIEDASDLSLIDKLVADIASDFAKIYVADKEEYAVTCSIGIAFSEITEPNFEVLFKKADIALFAAKSEGKNIHKYYDDSLGFNSDNNMLNEYNMKESFSSLQETIDSAIITSAIDLLFDSKDTISAVKILLSRISEHFDAEYVSVVTLKENRAGNYSYKGIWIPNCSRINVKGNQLSNELVSQHASLFNSDNLFYCSDIETIKTIAPDVYDFLLSNGTKSFLQCANIQHDDFLGFVSLGKCTQSSTWSVSEVRTFSILCKILFSAVGKLPIK